VRACVEATAEANGVNVVPAEDDVMQDADERVEQIKSMLAKLHARLPS
jgi:hypothetical protein